MLIGKMVSTTVDGRRKNVLVKKKKCSECGEMFIPKRVYSLFCTRTCGKVNERKKSREQNNERSKKWYAENKENRSITRKAKYWSNPELARQKTKEWREKNPDKAKSTQRRTKDNMRHGGLGDNIIKDSEYMCFMCKKDTRVGWRDACVHHATFNKDDHSEQVLLCRSCHAKIHRLNKS